MWDEQKCHRLLHSVLGTQACPYPWQCEQENPVSPSGLLHFYLALFITERDQFFRIYMFFCFQLGRSSHVFVSVTQRFQVRLVDAFVKILVLSILFISHLNLSASITIACNILISRPEISFVKIKHCVEDVGALFAQGSVFLLIQM